MKELNIVPYDIYHLRSYIHYFPLDLFQMVPGEFEYWYHQRLIYELGEEHVHEKLMLLG